MSRTLTNILIVGAAIAVNAIPGIGQALSAVIVGGVGVGAAATTALTFAGLAAASSLVGLGPSLPKPDTVTTAIKQRKKPESSRFALSGPQTGSGIIEMSRAQPRKDERFEIDPDREVFR